MNLSNFKQFIPSRIFKRGEDYFQNGFVQNLKQDNAYTYSATVVGSEKYLVFIELNNNYEIVFSQCDCPHALENFCKHQVAVCLKILDSHSSRSQVNPTNTAVRSKLIYNDILDKNELRQSGMLVQSSITSAKHRGFIDYHQSFNALHGAESVVKLMDIYIDTNRYQMAVMTGLQTLQPVVKALQFSDDSSGNFGELIQQILAKINFAVSCGVFSWTSKEKNSMFTQILKASENKIYADWSDWKFTLLRVAMLLCEDEKLYNIMEQHLKMLELPLQSELDFMTRFEFSQLKILQFDLLSTKKDEQAIESFLKENLYLNAIKELAIERALVLKDLDEAMNIAVAGEREHAEYPGLVNQWRIHQYKIYKLLNDVPNQKSLAFQLVRSGNIELFNDFKQLYPSDDWQDVLENLLSILSNKRIDSTYVFILKQECLYERMLDYCRDNLHAIQQHAQWLNAEFPTETKVLYGQWLHNQAESASARPKYRQVCREIKIYRSLFGNDDTNLLIETLKSKFPKRTAFLDELNKINTKKSMQ
ncbi:SWIM zinc finger family protein [Paenisporosarcina sp. NPDC076898]|uniref:SWIM zinc finger family protein n=1 Tax=unclassified Paenisporosarcina TaxID=2642018 RepID=UPI003D0133FF